MDRLAPVEAVDAAALDGDYVLTGCCVQEAGAALPAEIAVGDVVNLGPTSWWAILAMEIDGFPFDCSD